LGCGFLGCFLGLRGRLGEAFCDSRAAFGLCLEERSAGILIEGEELQS
jgi:hypothetical protein